MVIKRKCELHVAQEIVGKSFRKSAILDKDELEDFRSSVLIWKIDVFHPMVICRRVKSSFSLSRGGRKSCHES